MVGESNSELRKSQPLGHLPASVDGAGRLNTPTRAQEYFKAHGIDEFFVTTLDERIALLYPLSVWLQHLEKLKSTPGMGASAERLNFLGNANGGEVKSDKTGRIMLPANLRAKIPLAGESVVLMFYSGFAKLMTKAVYEAEERAAKEHRAADLEAWRSLGLY